MNLAERYRPKSWAEVVGQPKAVSVLRTLADRNALGGQAIWISGGSGRGKTSLARLAAHAHAEDLNVIEVDAGELTTAALRELGHMWHFRGIGEKPGRAWIINEAHGLRRDSMRLLLTMMEPIPAHVLLVFTTTAEGQETLLEDKADANPLLSRCLRIALAERDLADAFAARAKEIAEIEGINGKPLSAYKRLAMDHRNNMRAILNAVEVGALKGVEA